MFTRRIKLFEISDIPIFVDLSWFLVVVLISWSLATSVFPSYYESESNSTYWAMGFAGAIGLFASILAHELGHSVVARSFLVPIRGITLFIFGGVAEMAKEPPSAKAEFWVAIAGPVVSLLISIGLLATYYAGESALPPALAGVLWYLGLINGILVVFNMIPAFPLDGGRVLRAILWHVKGNLGQATKVTAAIGSGFGLVLIGLGVVTLVSGNIIGGIWQALIGMFLRNAASSSYEQVLVRRALEGESINRLMHPHPVVVAESINLRELVEDYVYRYHFKMYPVVDDGQLIGCVTTRQLQSIPREEWDVTRVGDVMMKCSVENTISPRQDALAALSQMNRTGASRLMVVNADQLVGIISLKDLMNFISLKMQFGDEVDQETV